MDIEKMIQDSLLNFSISDEIDVLNNLELYKTVPIYELDERFKALDDNFKCLPILPMRPGDLLTEFEEVDFFKDYDKSSLLNIIEELRIIEKEYNLLLDCTNFPEKIKIIYCIGSNREDLMKASIKLGAYDVELISVSKVNFNALLGVKNVYNPIILFKRIVAECINANGSDIHIFTIHNEQKIPEYKVAFRINNDLLPYADFDFDYDLHKEVIRSVVSKRTNANQRDIDSIYGLQTSVEDLFDDGEVELRLCCNKVVAGYHCVCRIQTKKTVTLHINELGFTEEDESILYRVAARKSGLTLITGAIRSGKNTTAFAIGNELVKQPIKIVDYSSPIELYMPFPQVDYMGDVEVLKNCMRSAKKQDINVAFLNEIPNKEVAFAVRDLINSSIHVITTTHVDRIWHVFYKLKELYGEDYRDLISQINALVNQKMYKRVCSSCSAEFPIATADMRYRHFAETFGIEKYRQNRGCDECIHAKIRPVAEILYFTDEIKSTLLECQTIQQMEQFVKKTMFANKASLEFKLAKEINACRITLSDLDTII